MTRGVFVTGTDTHVGKTWISLGLVTALKGRGLRTGAMKPVASGCIETAEGLRNEDALRLQAAANVPLAYRQVNPVSLAPPIAPHLAAREAGTAIDVQALSDAFRVLAGHCEWVVVEGAGGWRVPLGDDETLADLVRAMVLPVILVVGVRLGCLNHALLSAEAIRGDGMTLAGWVANLVEPDVPRARENVDTLRARLPAPLLGCVPHLRDCDPDAIAAALDLTPLGVPDVSRFLSSRQDAKAQGKQ